MKPLTAILLVLILVAAVVFMPERETPEEATQREAQWSAITAKLEAQGRGEVSVSSNTHDGIMRITFRGTMRQQMTPYDARQIAATVRANLGGSAFVRVADDTGLVLATASVNGVE